MKQAVYFLAEKLGKFAWEIEDMPYDEFIEWQAYYEMQLKAQKKNKNRNR